MEDKNEKMKEEKKEPKSRFRRGSIYERWADDEDDFIKCLLTAYVMYFIFFVSNCQAFY